MADNIAATQGTGTTLATDDIGGVHYPRIKLSIGADGTAGDVSTSNPIPVMLQRYTNDVIVSASSMGSSINSTIINAKYFKTLTIQLVWSSGSTPVGAFTIQTSDDAGSDEAGTGVTNWDTYTNSTVNTGANSGSFTYRLLITSPWVRLVYTRTSGSGTLDARYSGKGV